MIDKIEWEPETTTTPVSFFSNVSNIELVRHEPEAPLVSEQYVGSNGEQRVLVSSCTQQGKDIIYKAMEVFGNDFFDSLNTSVVGLLESENVVTSNLKYPNNTITELKLYLNTCEAAVKEVNVYDGDTSSFPIPSSAKVIFVGTYTNYKDLNFPESLNNIIDVYFSCNHSDVCDYYKFNFPEGSLRTYYGVSFNKDTKEIRRSKSYTYSVNSPQSNWDLIEENYRKRKNENNPISS
jgi:hypothetical protein